MLQRHVIGFLAGLMLFGTSSLALAAAKITLVAKVDQLAYDKKTFTVKAGEEVTLTFKNPSSMPHNVVITQPGQADKVMNDSIAAGNDKGWVSDGPEVLFKTPLIDGQKNAELTFKAPAEPGDYPFLCTFPGHGVTMRGTMKVKK